MGINFGKFFEAAKKVISSLKKISTDGKGDSIDIDVNINGTNNKVTIIEINDLKIIKKVYASIEDDIQVNIVSSYDNLWLHTQKESGSQTCINIGKFYSFDKNNKERIFWIGAETTEKKCRVFLYVNKDLLTVQLENKSNVLLEKGVYYIDIPEFSIIGEFDNVLEEALKKTLKTFLEAVLT